MKKYDVIIIGAGSAGLGSAGVANLIGLKVLMIEKGPKEFGGDCTNYGCVPSKALIHISKKFHEARKASRFGLQTSGKADMDKILNHIHLIQDHIRNEEDAEHHRTAGIDVELGLASFRDEQTVVVNEIEYTARLILLCTGTSPRTIELPGMQNFPVYTNENLFTECRELPDDLVVIGGGAIGCEMGQAFQRLGARVTIVNRGDRILRKERPEITSILTDRLLQEGVTIYNSAEVKGFSDGYAIIHQNNEPIQVSCSAVLIAIGRKVNTSGLNLSQAGIEIDKKGRIKVDEYYRSTNKRVYVLGDAAGKYMFSHGAEKMVKLTWRNILFPFFRMKDSTRNLSWVTFTDPEIATFGWSERELEKEGIAYYRQDQDFSTDDRALIEGYTYGRASYWMTDGRNLRRRKILSGTMIAPKAGDLIQEMQLAAEVGLSIGEIDNRVYPYPVASRINQKTIRGLLYDSYTSWMKKGARMSFRLFNR